MPHIQYTNAREYRKHMAHMLRVLLGAYPKRKVSYKIRRSEAWMDRLLKQERL